MSWRLAEIYRHPVKSLGEEPLDEVRLEPGRPLPYDRAWAVAHAGSDWDAERARMAALPATSSPSATSPRWRGRGPRWDCGRRLRLRSRTRTGRTFRSTPTNRAAPRPLTGWIAPLAEPRQPGPYRLARLAEGAFTDGEETATSRSPRTASRQALAEIAGQPLEPIRFRMNLWLDGPAPWGELDMVGREIAIGAARLRVVSRCERCRATTANPSTGESDVPVPTLLRRHLGHTDFGVNAQVVAAAVCAGATPPG